MADVVFRVTTTLLTPIDEPERGWCDRCNLSSVFTWYLTIEHSDRLLTDGIAALSVCEDCGERRWT